MKLSLVVFAIMLQMLLFVKNSNALTPDEIAVIVNKNGWHSIELGKYYVKKRAVPEDNILRLWTTDKETISRENYEKQIAAPVKKFLEKKNEDGREIKCLVLMFGMPAENSDSGIYLSRNREIKRV